jgi:hypothetical protein
LATRCGADESGLPREVGDRAQLGRGAALLDEGPVGQHVVDDPTIDGAGTPSVNPTARHPR